MKVLIDNEIIYKDVTLESGNRIYMGDVFATIVVLFFTIFSLTISGWSVLVYTSGHVDNGGPVAKIFTFVFSAIM
ncbi:MAG: hypothetical protein SCH71_11855 [Desulfobulbaceae bacterium]|nr:hypothetical protein [Desulfobulbaceae bacterium]